MNDDRLQSAFAELRRVEAAKIPVFAIRRRAEARRSTLALAFASLLVIVTVVALLPRRPPAPSIEAWRAPTDFLLQTPGRDLLTTTPDLKGTRQ